MSHRIWMCAPIVHVGITRKSSMQTPCKKWGWDINPLVLGWGTGPEKTRFPKCLGFALDLNLVFFWILVPGWFLNSQIRRELFTLLDFGPENQIVVMTISTIFMRQNRSISFFQFEGGGGRRGQLLPIYLYKGLMAQPHIKFKYSTYPNILA